jgi:hypothetical protein
MYSNLPPLICLFGLSPSHEQKCLTVGKLSTTGPISANRGMPKQK